MKDKETRIEFKVIDNNTGREADIGKIALKEDWAKDLMYCDMQGFAILDDGNLVLLDECGKFEYCPSERFSIKFEDSVVLSRKEYEKLKYTWITDSDTYKKGCKETAEKFAKLIEFHSISKRDESGYETFTISNLCMREILREEFGFTNEELETM